VSIYALNVVVSGEAPLGSGRERMASVEIGGMTVFSELVYDNPENTAEQNIITLFGSRLQSLLDRDA